MLARKMIPELLGFYTQYLVLMEAQISSLDGHEGVSSHLALGDCLPQ